MTRRTASILALIILASALLGSSMLTRGHFWGDDFAAYIGQAKSITTGDMQEFLEHNTFTVLRSSEQLGPQAYPWGFPLLLVPVYTLFGVYPLGLKLPGLLAYISFLLVFFLFTKRCFTLTESLLAVSLFAFNPELLLFLDNILSDVPFLLFSTLSLLLADIYAHETKNKRRLILAAATGISIYTATFMRTQGLILFGSLLLFQSMRLLGQRTQRARLIIDSVVFVATFGILWTFSTLIFPGGQTSYLNLYAGFSIDLFIDNIQYYSQVLGMFFEHLPGSSWFFGIFVVFFFLGMVSSVRDNLFYILYITLYFVVLWTWPERQGFRFLLPMFPLFIYFAIQGIKSTLNRVSEGQKTVLQNGAYAYLLLISVLFAYYAGSFAYINLRDGRQINGPFDPYSLETYNFIKEQTSPESVIIFFKPRAMRLMTDRDALAITECERIPEGDYLALSKKVGENLQIPPEQIRECNLSLDKAFENRRFVVYEVME